MCSLSDALCVLAVPPPVRHRFADNFIMIVAGDRIDSTFGVALGITTLAAAGLGNLVSDVVGVGLGGVIEAASDRLGIPAAKLTRYQMKTRAVKITNVAASIVGIALGCLLGMVPLLWLNNDDAERKKQLRVMFARCDVDGDGHLGVGEIADAFGRVGVAINRETLREVIHGMETDAPGFLNFEEFCELEARWQSLPRRDRSNREAIVRSLSPSLPSSLLFAPLLSPTRSHSIPWHPLAVLFGLGRLLHATMCCGAAPPCPHLSQAPDREAV